jgi:CHAT domain-containing protein
VRFELPRLPGSSKEVRSCAAIWEGSSARVLEGLEATPANLSSALREKPDVLHLATHVLASDGEPAQASIMLSLGPDGRSEGLLPAAIRGLGPAPALVVLSGCQSGRGPALPGAGLLGLSRAWLAAGARAVVASLWATPDDSGQLFVRFYSHLQRMRHEGARAPTLALRQAQLEMLACGDWRARPEYWAAYVVIGVL